MVKVLEEDEVLEVDLVDGNEEVEVEETDNDVLVVLEVVVDEGDVVDVVDVLAILDDISNELEVVLITHDE